MKVINSARICANIETVWNMTEDVETWPIWTLTVESVKFQDVKLIEVGSIVLLKQPGMREKQWIVTELKKGKKFTWESRLWGSRCIATHTMSTTGSGTINTLSVEVKGATEIFFGRLFSMLWANR